VPEPTGIGVMAYALTVATEVRSFTLTTLIVSVIQPAVDD
jgi:hypothetical protein